MSLLYVSLCDSPLVALAGGVSITHLVLTELVQVRE